MTKADIVDEIADKIGLTKKDVADTVDEFLHAVCKALSTGTPSLSRAWLTASRPSAAPVTKS